MKKQYIYTLVLLLLGCLKTNAQEVEAKNKAFKIYSNFHILGTEEASRFQLTDSSSFHFLNLSIAFSKNRKKPNRFMEGEISFLYSNKDGDRLLRETSFDTIVTPPRLIISERLVPISSEDIVFRLRFELGRWVKTFKEEKLKLGWSSSYEAHIHTSEITPRSSDTFLTSEFQAYLILALIPRIQYDLTSNLFLDLNFPIEIMSLGVDFTTIDNPILTDRQKKQGGFNYDIGGEILLRFGLGYRF